MPSLPSGQALIALGVAAVALTALHLWATGGTGTLNDPLRAQLAVTPRTTLSLWWHHLWAGLFHKSWGHIAYNLAVLAVAFPFAVRQQGPWLTLANAYWIGPVTVLALHVAVVLPLASAGVPYAVRALDVPLVGASVMVYSIAGAALVPVPVAAKLAVAAALVAFEAVLARTVTGPFVGLYHVAGFGMGFAVRVAWLRFA